MACGEKLPCHAAKNPLAQPGVSICPYDQQVSAFLLRERQQLRNEVLILGSKISGVRIRPFHPKWETIYATTALSLDEIQSDQNVLIFTLEDARGLDPQFVFSRIK